VCATCINSLTPWGRVLERLRVAPVSQDISSALWNLNVHYRVHNSPPLASAPRQMNPVLTPPIVSVSSTLLVSSHLHVIFHVVSFLRVLLLTFFSLTRATCSGRLIFLYLSICFKMKSLRFAHTVYLCVPYGSHNKQRLFPQTALTGWAL
jgi:hypothetical protein